MRDTIRCRKKMKRVERRGTLESQLTNNSMGSVSAHPSGVSSHATHPLHSAARGLHHTLNSSERPVHRTDTLPANHSMSSRSGGAFGPAGTHLIPQPNSFATQDRYRDDIHPRPPSSSAIVHERSPRNHRSPPTPPAIVTLAGAGEDTLDTKKDTVHNGSHASRHGSVDNRPSPANGHFHRSQSSGGSAPLIPVDDSDVPVKRSPPSAEHSMTTIHKLTSPPPMDLDVDAEADPDADADADADADVDDAELELQEAVDAAEAHSSSTDARPKTPEDHVV